MEKVFVASLALLFCLNTFFFGFRSVFAFRRGESARDAIGRYCDDLIKSRQYDTNTNYFKDMLIPFDQYCFSFWLWGKYSRVRPEYKSILEPYFDR